MATKRKRGLGRGLDALLPKSTPSAGAADPDDASPVQTVSVDPRQLLPNPFQPRRTMNPEGIDELARSIMEQGVLQPILARKTDKGFEIIAGERRAQASIQAGLERVPVIVSGFEDEAAFEAALIENIQREDLSPIEEALAYQRLVKEFGLTQEAIAKKVGKNRVTVANSLRLLKLPPEVRESIQRGEITAGHARALLACKTTGQVERLTALIVDRGISVREAEEWVRRHQAKGKERPGGVKGGERSPFVLDLEARLMEEIGLRVKVKELSGSKGRVEFPYNNHDELDRLLKVLGLDEN